jgi:hypothetical protein
MSFFPAYASIGRDVQLGYARWRVYMHLVHAPVLNHVCPVDVKVDGVAHSLTMSRRKVRDSLNWLVARGYLTQHARDAHGVRSLTLTWEMTADTAD